MLKPDYFVGKEDRLIELYRELEEFILKDISGRLLTAGKMTATADRLLAKLRMMGESQQAIQKKLMELTGLTKSELRTLLQDAVLTSWEDDAATFEMMGREISNPLENDAVISVMDAEYKKSLGELENLTRTTMEQSQIDLMNMLDAADLRVASGVQSYSAAICDILDQYAGRGMVIEYPTGAKRTLEAAVRMCVVTSMNQTAAQVTNQYIAEAQSEYVLVSAHLGARVQGKGQPYLAGHDNWQGRVFRIRGSEEGIPNLLESTGYDIDPVTGEGKVVDPLGLHGYNCRHSHQPWDKRLRNPWRDKDGNLILGDGSKVDEERNRKQYELQQKQRAYERAIRKTKKELLVKRQELELTAEADMKRILHEDYDKLADRLSQQNKTYNEFCAANNLQPQYDRMKVSGLNRQQSSRANGVATRYENEQVFRAGQTCTPERNLVTDIIYSKKVKEFTKTANEINVELDSICVRESKWSGKIIMDSKMNGLGSKEWNCDIKLTPDAGYDTKLHELLHARSVSYFDLKAYIRHHSMEEGTVELLTEEICKKKQIDFIRTYENEVKCLRRINRRAKLYADEYDFAVDLFNIPLTNRSEWLIKKINDNYTAGLLSDAERERAFDSLVKILEEVR